MKFKKSLSFVIAYSPLAFLVNIILLMAISLIGKNTSFFNIDSLYLIIGLTEVLSLLYILKYRKHILTYIIMISLIYISLIIFRPLSSIAFLPFVVYIILFENRLKNFRDFLDANLSACCYSNSLDLVLVIILCGLKKNYDYLLEALLQGYNFLFNFINISVDVFLNSIFMPSMIILLITAIIFRSVKIIGAYKAQHNLVSNRSEAFWNSSILSFGISLVIVLLYLSTFLSLQDNLTFINVLLIYSLFSSFNLILWNFVYQKINQGAENRQTVIVQWLLIVILILALSLLNQIESDLISILTWFLPIFLPIIIGEIYTQKNDVNNGIKPTLKMKKHLYWLQLLCFNTLAVLNIITSLSTKKIIVGNEIIENNILKNKIAIFFEKLPSYQDGPRWLSNFFASTLIVLISLIIAFFLSIIIIWLLKIFYLNKDKDFFEEGDENNV